MSPAWSSVLAILGLKIGLLGKPKAPVVWQLICPVAQKLIESGVGVGKLVFDPPFADGPLSEAFSFVAWWISTANISGQPHKGSAYPVDGFYTARETTNRGASRDGFVTALHTKLSLQP